MQQQLTPKHQPANWYVEDIRGISWAPDQTERCTWQMHQSSRITPCQYMGQDVFYKPSTGTDEAVTVIQIGPEPISYSTRTWNSQKYFRNRRYHKQVNYVNKTLTARPSIAKPHIIRPFQLASQQPNPTIPAPFPQAIHKLKKNTDMHEVCSNHQNSFPDLWISYLWQWWCHQCSYPAPPSALVQWWHHHCQK